MDRETELTHLIRMAIIPGFKDHAWHRAKQLDAMYEGISTALKEAMLLRIKEGSSETKEVPSL